jgi:hypothetical protein
MYEENEGVDLVIAVKKNCLQLPTVMYNAGALVRPDISVVQPMNIKHDKGKQRERRHEELANLNMIWSRENTSSETKTRRYAGMNKTFRELELEREGSVHVAFDFAIGGRDYFRSCGDDEYLSGYERKWEWRRIHKFEGSTRIFIARDSLYSSGNFGHSHLDALFCTPLHSGGLHAGNPF